MDILGIKFSNKYYNNKERKHFDSFNFRMLKKRKARLAKIEKKPLSDKEKRLYFFGPLSKNNIVNCNGFYKLNGVSHILYTISKSNSEQFYDDTKELIRKYQPTKFLGTTLMDYDHKQRFMSLSTPNSLGMMSIGHIEPRWFGLEKFVSYIDVNAFGISNDSIGIDFQIHYNNEFIVSFNGF